ncbi:hypothetical protein QWY85_12305 [Neolewinella lacunae]|uniref:Uncharacterized protein n=1 Tax=Neolewinella lacunae TaxID=1517758 RepID=A0A923T856_9BACT|nr:hypothetical protein [Neolewinella lacunae]MBC6995245.1 hypothetical protein [Neolewinella lacunae]MDN3635446.1 hypothetical protein [Neolewinella lacunae]
MTLHFTCTLMSKVVLSARAATEGQVDSLDYLPGAKFMGIVARQYESMDDPARHDLFHNGKVRFGNAYPFAKGVRFYPAPLVYFTKKGSKPTDTDGVIYLDHLLDETKRKQFSKDGDQLKQVRSGYIDAGGKKSLTIETDYQLKSAYDADLRRSKDSQMYGYSSIPRGTVFAFSVEDTTGKYAEKIKKALVGEHGLGRSRTAEYGRVRIEVAEAPKDTVMQSAVTNVALVYALSDLCLYDKFGQPKQPTAEDLGFSAGAKIDWTRTQVRSGEYQSWNTIRWNRNTDRWVIGKGSVFCVENVQEKVSSQQKWVGSYHQEGFGQIWINPPFLEATKGDHQRPGLKKVEDQEKVAPLKTTNIVPENTNKGLLDLLNRRAALDNLENTIYRQVNAFIEKQKASFSGISSSQWGTLRSYASHAANSTALHKLIFDEKTGFLHRGQSEKVWRKCRDELQKAVSQIEDKTKNKPNEKDDRPLLFLQKLAAEMAKRTKNQEA